MEYVYVGKIVNTHGIKGEVRLLSNFEYKKEVFKKDFKLYIGKDKTELVVNTYRVHKNFDMITFTTINDINDVLIYKASEVFINKEDLKVDYFIDDINGMEVYTDKLVGKVIEILTNGRQEIFRVKGKKEFLVPNVETFIKKVDNKNRIIYINDMPGLIDED